MKQALFLAAIVFALGAVDAQVVRQVTDSHTTWFLPSPRVTADGSEVFVVSTGDLAGENDDGRFQVFRIDLDTGTTTQITSLPFGLLFGWLTPMAITGDGSRVAFTSAEDLTGQNADRSEEIFLMDVDGTNLTQVTDMPDGSPYFQQIELTPDGSRLAFAHQSGVWVIDADGSGLTQVSSGPAGQPSISADGQRVVFVSGGIYAVEADGSNLRQLTTWYSQEPRISADGSTVSFIGTGTLPDQSPGWCSSDQQLGAIDWDGSNPIKLSGLCLGSAAAGTVYGSDPAPDGQQIYYVGSDLFGVVRKVDRYATTETVLAPPNGGYCELIGAAADESRVAAVCTGDPAGTNPDLSRELYAVETDGSAVVQRTFTPPSGSSEAPAIMQDTGTIVFASDADPLQESLYPGKELYRVDADGSGLERITTFLADDAEDPDTTADGSLVVFTVRISATGFHELHTVSSPGNAVTPIADPSFNLQMPAISADGSRIVAVEGLEGNIYAMGPDGSGLTPVAIGGHPRLDGTGATMVFARFSNEVRVYEFAGGTELLLSPGAFPDISRDGQRIVFQSDVNPFGVNPDGNVEIFSVRPDGSQLLQLTMTEGFDNIEPAISGDGLYVYYVVAYPELLDLYRVHLVTRQVERVGGLPCGSRVDVDQYGGLAVFASSGDCAGANADRSSEIFVIDRAATSVLRFGPDDPTALRWDAGSGPTHYDVIRGDVAELTPGGDLGTVLCIENDSADNSTLGSPDPEEPTSGQVFFYLVRELPGGDYGTGSSGTPRVVSAGDCAN